MTKTPVSIRRPLARALTMALVAALSVSVAGCSTFGGKGKKNSTPTVGQRVPILSRIDSGSSVDASIANLSVIVPPAVANTEWAQPGGNAANAIGHVQLSATPARAWTASIAGASPSRRLANAPVVAAGKLFVVDTEAMVHAFDAATGAKVWTHKLVVPKDLESAAFGGGASYSGGRLYVTNGAGDVAALDAETGTEVWKVKPAGPLRGAPTVAFNQIFVMTQNNQIYALSAVTGEVEWQESSSVGQSGVFGVASPAAGQSTVIAGYSNGEISAYRYENGRNLWGDALARTSISTEVGALTDVDADPIIDAGRVYALGQGGRMAAYELITGQRIWELSLAGISTPALAGEWIFTLTDDARLLAIARSSGKIRWITQLQQYRDEKDKKGPIFWSGPVLAGNNLWMANSRGKLFRADVATGTATEYAELNGRVSLPPVVAGQTLYILTDDGKIHAFR